MADSMTTAAEAAGASERAVATEPVAASSSAGPQAPQISQPHPLQPPPPPAFAVIAPPITRSQMALNEPPRRMRELRPRLPPVAHGAAAAAAATVTQLAHPPQRAPASSSRAAAAAASDSSPLPSPSPDLLHLAQSPPSTAVAAAAFTPPGPDAYDEPAAEPRRALFFVAPDAGLVQNKPFSFELRATLHHASAAGAAHSPPVASLLFQLALKVSAKPMEKRSNVYEPIDAVWIKAKETGEPKQTDADDTDEDESGDEASEDEPTDAAAAASRSRRRAQRSRLSSSATSAASASSSEASSSSAAAALAMSTLTSVPIRTVVLSKSAREKIRDRSIGLEAIITSRPAESAMATAAARSLHALLSRLHVAMTAVAQHRRGGLLEIVTTKGGAIAARPQQRYILIQAGFGYKLALPAMPAAYELRFNSLQIRSWESAITRIPLLPTPLAMPLFPTPPKRRRSSTRKGSGPGRSDRAAVSSSSRSGSRTASAASQQSTRSSSRQRKKKKRRGESSDSSYTSDASSPPPRSKTGQRAAASAASSATRTFLQLPTRHGRSLTALLSASKQLEQKQNQPLRVRASSDGPAGPERKSSEPPSAAGAVAGQSAGDVAPPLMPLLPAKRKHAPQPRAAGSAAASYRRSHKKKARHRQSPQSRSGAAGAAAFSSSSSSSSALGGGGRALSQPPVHGASSSGAEPANCNNALDYQSGAFDAAMLGLGLGQNPGGLNGRLGGGGGLAMGMQPLHLATPSAAIMPPVFQPTTPPSNHGYQPHASLCDSRAPLHQIQFARSQSPPREQLRPNFHIRCDEFPPPGFPPAPLHQQQQFAAAAGAYPGSSHMHSSQSAFALYGLHSHDPGSSAHGGLPWSSVSASQSSSVSPPRYGGSAQQHLSAALGSSASSAFQFAGASVVSSSYDHPPAHQLLSLPPLSSPTSSPQPPRSAPGSGGQFLVLSPNRASASPHRASASPHRHLLQSPNRAHMAGLLPDNSSPIHSSQPIGGSPQPPGSGSNLQSQQDEVTAKEMFLMIASPPPPNPNVGATAAAPLQASLLALGATDPLHP